MSDSNTNLILCVDSEVGIIKVLRHTLEEQGFAVIQAHDSERGLVLVERQQPNLILSEVKLPTRSGIQFLQSVKEKFQIPFIFLTGKDHDSDKVNGLKMGADDYITKPFNAEEVAARIRAVLRRYPPVPVEERPILFENEKLEVDLGKRIVRKDGKIVVFTRTEWKLFDLLVSNPGKVMLPREILRRGWGPEYVDDFQYLRVWIYRVRNKIEVDPENPTLIKTIGGVGYVFDTNQKYKHIVTTLGNPEILTTA